MDSSNITQQQLLQQGSAVTMVEFMSKADAGSLIISAEPPQLVQERELKLLVHLNKPETTLLGVRKDATKEYLIAFLEQQLQAAPPPPPPPRGDGTGGVKKAGSNESSPKQPSQSSHRILERGSGEVMATTSQQGASAVTLALGDKEVSVRDTFPGVTYYYHPAVFTDLCSELHNKEHLVPSSGPHPNQPQQPRQMNQPGRLPMPTEVLKKFIERMWRPVLLYAPLMMFGEEATYVHLFRLMFNEAIVLLDGQFDDVVVEEPLRDTASLEKDGNGVQSLMLGMEQTMYVPGRFRGRIELTFKQKKGDLLVYIGALEVGLHLTGKELEYKTEQCEKEALCMWYINAEKGCFDPVWVLLSNGYSVRRFEYRGFNTSSPPKGIMPYKKKLPSNQLRGEFRCTVGAQLWQSVPKCIPVNSTTEAVLVMLGGLIKNMPAMPTDVEAMEERIKAREEQLQAETKKLADYTIELDSIAPEEFQPTKRARYAVKR